ncbi:MAG: hypothetical protein IPM97_15675 [Bdellovibrionaceae bacterium]|nr:hypothetical protein [Pseudobdellovibrionaceae bacterium]
MKIFLSSLLLLFCIGAEAKSPNKTKFGISQWYRFSATSDNKNHHEFKNIQGGEASYPKKSIENGCQFFIFFCGLEEKTKNVNKICDSAWAKYKSIPDVEFGGWGAATETGYHDDAKTLSRLFFTQGLEYASLKSFKIDLAFDGSGKVNLSDSKIFFRGLVGTKPSDDDSAYKFLDFANKAAFFELGAKCK